MTYRKDEGLVYDEHVFECDECGDEFSCEGGENGASFNGAWRRAKDEGWTSFKLGDEWHHLCPSCSED